MSDEVVEQTIKPGYEGQFWWLNAQRSRYLEQYWECIMNDDNEKLRILKFVFPHVSDDEKFKAKLAECLTPA